MSFNVFQNIAGTISSIFRLGRSGPTLRTGTADPNSAPVVGNEGDIYIQYGTNSQSIFQCRGGYWRSISGEGFKRSTVTQASYTVKDDDYYIGVNYNGNVDIYLPAGVPNKEYIIKDESGLVDGNTRTITVHASGSETIDGSSSVSLEVGYLSLGIVYGSEWHII